MSFQGGMTRDRAIGMALDRARIAAGLRQEDLAQFVGVAQPTISTYLRGQQPIKASMVADMATACGTSASVVFLEAERILLYGMEEAS